jgi:hypothetical protein
MTEYQYDLLYFLSESVSIIFHLGVLILGILYLRTINK